MQHKDLKDGLVKALDASIAKTASKILADTLEKPPINQMSSDEQCNEVQRRAEKIKSALQRLQMPDYNDDVTTVVCFLVYHPQHIGVSHTIIKWTMSSCNSEKLIVSNTAQFALWI